MSIVTLYQSLNDPDTRYAKVEGKYFALSNSAYNNMPILKCLLKIYLKRNFKGQDVSNQTLVYLNIKFKL